jgi:hypothetical protein
MLKTIQCGKPSIPGASASQTISANDSVCLGTSVQESCGEIFLPSQVNFFGISPPLANDELAKFIRPPVGALSPGHHGVTRGLAANVHRILCGTSANKTSRDAVIFGYHCSLLDSYLIRGTKMSWPRRLATRKREGNSANPGSFDPGREIESKPRTQDTSRKARTAHGLQKHGPGAPRAIRGLIPTGDSDEPQFYNVG